MEVKKLVYQICRNVTNPAAQEHGSKSTAAPRYRQDGSTGGWLETVSELHKSRIILAILLQKVSGSQHFVMSQRAHSHLTGTTLCAFELQCSNQVFRPSNSFFSFFQKWRLTGKVTVLAGFLQQHRFKCPFEDLQLLIHSAKLLQSLPKWTIGFALQTFTEHLTPLCAHLFSANVWHGWT